MTDYGGLNRVALIERLRRLEAELASTQLQTTEQTLERRRDRAALRDSEARLRAILDTAVEGIITIDEQGTIESSDSAAENIFGYQADEIIGQEVDALMPSPDGQAHDGYLENYARTGHARIIGIGRAGVGQRKSGGAFPSVFSVREVRLEGRRLFTG